MKPEIHGYDYAKPSVAHSPVTLDELRQIEVTVGWSDEDARTLQRHEELFRKNAEEMVDTWRKVIGSQPHLAKWFCDPNSKPDGAYKAAVKKNYADKCTSAWSLTDW
jgi:hypothetical protein